MTTFNPFSIVSLIRIYYDFKIIFRAIHGGSEVDLSLWLSRLTYHNVVDGSVDFTTFYRTYLFSKGHVNIKTGSSGFDTHEITEDELPPEIFTR